MTHKPRRSSRTAKNSLRFALGGAVLDVPRDDGLDLLEWLGLGRPEFGAIDVRELAPRCRRRLWPLPRNVDPPIVDAQGHERRPAGALARGTLRLLQLTEHGARAGIIVFG